MLHICSHAETLVITEHNFFETCQVVKQNLSLFIHDILNERFHPGLLRPVHISLREGSFGLIMLLFIMQKILFRTDCLLPTTNSLTIFHEASPYFLVKWGQNPHDLLLQTNIGRRMNFDCPSVPSGQNSIFPMRPGDRDDGISTLRSHQYDLADEGVTEEIKRQTFSKHYFTPLRRKVLMRGILDQFVRDSPVGLFVCTRRGDVVVYLDNFTFLLAL